MLIVDDNATSRRTLNAQLTAHDYRVESTGDPLAVPGLMRKAHAAGTAFDAVLIDELMPRRGGLAVADSIREIAACRPRASCS